ncbi:MAG: dipeptide epimerase [Armatimonadetes bacterium]|nr:dipeptide epimerase [Armatimonadota bacterium]
MPEIISINARAVDMPLKEVFETAKGSKTVASAAVVEMRLSNGITCLGAATPAQYVTGEDRDMVLASIESCASNLVGMEVSSYRRVFDAIAEMLPDRASSRAALEMAVLDGFCRLYGIPMYKFFGGALDRVETDLTVAITNAQRARELASEAAALGFNHLKVKVGSKDPDDDLARVLAMSEGAPNCTIRLDANQGFSATFAVEFAKKLLDAGVRVDMLEQPVDRDDLDALKYVTQHTSVPVFADEAVRTPADALRLIEMDAVDGINIKIMKSGISGALDIIALAKAAGKELMLGSMIEVGIGLSTSVHFACGTGVFSRLDLDAHLLAAEEPYPGGFTAEGPMMLADSTVPGHGAAPRAET